MTYLELINEARNIPSLRAVRAGMVDAETMAKQAQRYKKLAKAAFRFWEQSGYRDNQALAMNTAFEIVQRGYEDIEPCDDEFDDEGEEAFMPRNTELEEDIEEIFEPLPEPEKIEPDEF